MTSCNCNRCHKGCAPKNPCGCRKPFLDITEMPDTVSVLSYNFDGATAWYDYGNMIYKTQTDTKVRVDAIRRVLEHLAERHVDTISAHELGSILHIADLGDVDITGVEDNSLFVYQKDNNCSHGCEGVNNSWIAWNSNDHMVDSMRTIMGFDADGAPQTLLPPANAGQFYIVGWNGENQVSYKQIEEVSEESITETIDGTSYIRYACVDPNTNELVFIRKAVS